MPTLEGSTVLVTGANRGIGAEFVRQLLDRGAAKVYASARQPQDSDDARVVPLALDVTDQDSIRAAAAAAPDVNVLINNAGVVPTTPLLLEESDDDIRAVMETNVFGPLLLARAFIPALRSHPGAAALIDIHSALSWHAQGGIYSAAKAALWSITNSLRLELDPQVHVVGVHVGYVDTDMSARVEAAKLDPADLVRQVLDATEANLYEVLADDASRQLKAALSAPLGVAYPSLAGPR